MLTADTNLLVYAVDERDMAKHEAASHLVRRLEQAGAPLGLQAIGEYYSALTRRLKRPTWQAAQSARNYLAKFQTFAITGESVERALAETSAGRFSYWDALLLASADLAGCTVLLSEDMTDGTRLGHVEVVHPFAERGLSKRAEAALASFGRGR
ncbi:MAG: hypothetical protein U1E87_01760 [Alphaproteobacteria bacterium]